LDRCGLTQTSRKPHCARSSATRGDQADIYGRRREVAAASIDMPWRWYRSAFALLPAQNATGNWIKSCSRVPVRIHINATNCQEPVSVGLSTVSTSTCMTKKRKDEENKRPGIGPHAHKMLRSAPTVMTFNWPRPMARIHPAYRMTQPASPSPSSADSPIPSATALGGRSGHSLHRIWR